MSDPHSRSPTPNHPSFTNTLFPSEPTPSRPDTHEYTPLYPIEETTQQSISRHTPSHSFRSQTPYPRSAEVSITPVLTRSPQVSPGRLARPMREQSPEEKAGRRTPSSSSQGDMADTEMDAERSQQVMMSTPPVTVPSKKKRTRTLTTPHQSAVLHALLAQSRFPSTAVREEVGRSIGLSPRKVQIWFQNQRQKARRPRSQSGAPPTRPQQYTNLPTSLPNAERYDTARSDQGPSTVRFHTAFSHSPYDTQYRSDEHSYGRHLFPEAYRGPAHSSPLTQLLGPGMPGVDYRTSPSFRAQIIPARSPHSFTDRPPPAPRLHSQSPISMQRPTTSHASGRRHRQELSTTLPPLLFDSSQQRDCSPALGPSSMRSQFPHSAAHSTSDPHPSTPLESPFALRLSEPPSRQSMPIPPPFTLRSRWDFPFLPSSFSSRLETASWTRTNPSPSPRDTLSSAIGCEHPPPDQEELHRLAAPSRSDSVRQQETTSRPEYSPPMRSGRYDPVRAAVIPYEGTTSITTSPSSPPLQSTGENVTHSDDKHSYERRHCSPPGSN